jgi:hypothetical protein
MTLPQTDCTPTIGCVEDVTFGQCPATFQIVDLPDRPRAYCKTHLLHTAPDLILGAFLTNELAGWFRYRFDGYQLLKAQGHRGTQSEAILQALDALAMQVEDAAEANK